VDPSLKVVTHLPLRELWRPDGFTTTSRRGPLSKDEITQLLQTGPVQFVVVDAGFPPLWVAINDCYRFWKEEAKSHLLSAASKVVLSGQPDGYCYFASEWDSETAAPIVVLEKHH
jgi:hypothetical protein